MSLILGFVPKHVNKPAAGVVTTPGHGAADVRLAFMKAGGGASENAKGSLVPGLYLVATPIGNLEDITLRAVRVLKEADLIACEDTRQTQRLLNHYGIATRTASYHEHNEMTRAGELVLELEGGARVALVTDAGMPGISDPGFRLISLAIRHHVPVVRSRSVGVSGGAGASGLPTDSFRFSGFLPPKSGQRRQMLESIQASPRTQVFYEAPHRVKEAVEDIVTILGRDRHIVIAREVTKIHEEFPSGRGRRDLENTERAGRHQGRDHAADRQSGRDGKESRAGVNLRERLQQIMAEEKLDEKTALKRIAKENGSVEERGVPGAA